MPAAIRCRLPFGISVLALVAVATAAHAQEEAASGAGTLELGREASAVLTKSDPRLPDETVYHLWWLDGVAGDAFQVDLMSDDFDAYLLIRDQGKALVRDDDTGEGTNARVRIVLPSSGRYEVVANTLREGMYGRYTIVLSRPTETAMKRGVVGSIRRGEAVTGTLTDSDDRLSDDSVFRAYLFEGTAGDTIRVDMESDDFDTYLIIADAYGNRIEADDDSGDDRNARLTYALPYSGTFCILANAYRRDQYGDYSLTIR